MLIAINYHYIRRNFQAPYPSIYALSPEAFDRQLAVLQPLGEFISQADLKAHLEGKQALPDRAMLITFDDGLAEQYQWALPVLEARGIPAVFFVNTRPLTEERVLNVHKIHLLRAHVAPDMLFSQIIEAIEAEGLLIDWDKVHTHAPLTYRYDSEENARLKYLLNFVLDFRKKEELVDKLFETKFAGREASICRELYLNQAQLKDLAQRGYLGCHSHAHQPVGLYSRKERQADIALSKQLLEQHTDTEVYGFTYPYGSQEACMGGAEVLQKLGFSYAFTMERAINHAFYQPFYLSRFDTNDVPMGKSYLYQASELFDRLPQSTWNFNPVC